MVLTVWRTKIPKLYNIRAFFKTMPMWALLALKHNKSLESQQCDQCIESYYKHYLVVAQWSLTVFCHGQVFIMLDIVLVHSESQPLPWKDFSPKIFRKEVVLPLGNYARWIMGFTQGYAGSMWQNWEVSLGLCSFWIIT